MRSAIAEGYNSHLTVAQVAAAAGLHPNHAMHVFKSATGSSIGEYIQCFRLAHAKRLLANTNLILPLVTVKCGFGSERRLFEVFRQEVGITPNEYRRSFGERILPGEGFAQLAGAVARVGFDPDQVRNCTPR
jgi:transcriptional regulator GlxA family with amidase domain